MKAIYVLAAVGVGLISCKKDDPQAIFTTDQDIYFTKEAIQFNNTSEGGVSYYWNFGDGESSTLKNPAHTYTESGEYIVTLQVEGAKKTTPQEFSKTLNIYDEGELPDEVFANKTFVCDSITEIYKECSGYVTDNSTNLVIYTMEFGDDKSVITYSGAIYYQKYDVLNDSLIAFYDAYYAADIWNYEFDGSRLTLSNNNVYNCGTSYPPGTQGTSTYERHFYLE